MKEIIGNIWDFYDAGNWIVITTNGYVRKDGKAVMGAGVALQAAQRFPNLQHDLGDLIKADGNIVRAMYEFRVFAFPVKRNWWERADLLLIQESCRQLVLILNKFWDIHPPVYMVRPGCGNGGLNWKDVKPTLEKYFDDRFIVVEINRNASMVIESSD